MSDVSVVEVVRLIGKIVDRRLRQVRSANIGLRSDLRRWTGQSYFGPWFPAVKAS